ALEQFGPQCGACYTDVRFFNHTETQTMFQLADKSYRHVTRMGVNREVLRLLVRPGGAGMVICPSSVLALADAVRETGGFDRSLRVSEDSEFLFRLAMRTRFCYVNLPLVLFDRSPAEIRHVGVSSDWNKLEVFLRDSQLRLEGLLRLSEGLPREIRAVIREQLSLIHSGWANCYLERGENAKAREAALKAAQTNLNFNLAAKWLLMWMSPRLALRAVRQRQDDRKRVMTV
ncbi:MAG: hypothetical protein WBA09_08585, partial [Candidatus Acidiferrum sp.]